MEPRVGQVWKNKKRNPTSIFVITRVLVKVYKDQLGKPTDVRTRVIGLLTSGEDCLQHGRDLDLASLYKMFPYLLFNPTINEVEDK
jgi:hypothetical protein